jgi:predicted transposase/invertase (TIGR01784 family)
MGIYSLHGAAAEASALAEVLFNGVTKGGAKVVKKRPAVHSSSVPLFKNSTVNVQRGKGLRAWPKNFQTSGFHKTAFFQDQDETKGITIPETSESIPLHRTALLDPKDDELFKRIFTSKENSQMVVGLLNDFLELEGQERIETITILNNEFTPRRYRGKKSFFDIFCKDRAGKQFIVEMQKDKEKAFFKRLHYYASAAYSEQLGRGLDYGLLKPVYLVCIVDHTLFKDNQDYKHIFTLKHKKMHTEFPDGPRYVVIELEKFTKTNGRIKSAEDEFLYLLNNWQQVVSSPPDSKIKGAYETISSYNFSSMEYLAYQERMLDEMTRRDKEEELNQVRESVKHAEESLRHAEEQSKIAEEKARAADEKSKVVEESLRQAEEKSKIAEESLRQAEEKSKIAEEKSKVAEEKLGQMNIDTALKLIAFKLSTLQIKEATGLEDETVEKLRLKAKQERK